MLVDVSHPRGGGYWAAILGVAAVTALFAPLHAMLSTTTVALAYLLVVLFVASVWGRTPAMVASVLAMLCFNFFFLPPIHTFTIADPQNWVALSAFLITGVTAGQLSERAKRREEALQRSADEIRDLYDHAPCGYHSLDKEGVFVRINDTELDWLGYAREDVIGKVKFPDLLAPRSRRTFEDEFPRLKTEGAVRDIEFDLVRKDGTILPVLVSATAITDPDGSYLMSRSMVYDMTERKRSEEALRLASAYNRSLIEAALDPLVTIGPDGKITDVNAATEAATGHPRAALIGTDFSRLLHRPGEGPGRLSAGVSRRLRARLRPGASPPRRTPHVGPVQRLGLPGQRGTGRSESSPRRVTSPRASKPRKRCAKARPT